MDNTIVAITSVIMQAGIMYLYPFVILKPKYSAEYIQHKCNGDPKYPMKADMYINEARDGEILVKRCIIGIDSAIPPVATPETNENTIANNIAINWIGIDGGIYPIIQDKSIEVNTPRSIIAP